MAAQEQERLRFGDLLRQNTTTFLVGQSALLASRWPQPQPKKLIPAAVKEVKKSKEDLIETTNSNSNDDSRSETESELEPEPVLIWRKEHVATKSTTKI